MLFDGPLMNKNNPAAHGSFEGYMQGIQERVNAC
jgi:hypothetical protein